MENKKRNGFGTGMGFVLASAGSAVGLGNLWSFPYKTAKYGGAAFVLVYLLSVLVIGSVVMIADIFIGKRAKANPISAYKKANKNLGWLGLCAIIVPFMIASYYCVLGGYTIKFSLNSFNQNSTNLVHFTSNIGEVIIYSAIFLVLALIVVMAGIKSGIEKACKVLMPILFILLVLTVIYCLCLGNGVRDGLNYYLKPDFTVLIENPNSILAAMSQAFYSLSLGMGIMISYGSYIGKEIKIGKSVAIICAFDTLVALLAGLAIFPAMYHFIGEGGSVKFDNGPFLLFQTLPQVFDTLGVVGQIISFLFFGMVVIAALTSVIALLEVVTQFFIQKFRISRKKAILIAVLLCFAFSVPIGISFGQLVANVIDGKNATFMIYGNDLLSYFDDTCNTILIPTSALGSCIAIGWFIDKKITANPMKTFRTLKQDGLNLGKYSKFFAVKTKYITPILILTVAVFGIIDLLKKGSYGICVVITGFSIIVATILIYFIFFKNKETGCNLDEIDIAIATELKAEKKENNAQQ